MYDHERRSHARPAPLPFPTPEPGSPDDVRRGLETLLAGSKYDSVSLLPDTPDAVRRDLDALVAMGGHMSTRHDIVTAESTTLSASADNGLLPEPAPASTAPAEPPTASAARALHLRRQLAAAVDHGADLLAALGLPRLVEAGFAPIDVRAAGDALEAAVAALDAPGEDLEGDGDAEPSLGWITRPGGAISFGDASDCEDDSEENEGTSLETGGRGFVRAGPDDAEDDNPAEDDGSDERDDGPEPYLSVVEWDGCGDNWARTGHTTSGWETDVEDVNENGCGQYDEAWYRRTLGPIVPIAHGFEHDAEMRALRRQAEAVRQRVRPDTPRHDPDEVVPLSPGMALWRGPCVTRDGVPVVGWVRW